MERLYRSLIFLSPRRSLSSFKQNSFDLKSRAFVNLLNQSKFQSSTSIPNVDLTYEYNPLFPLPGRIGFKLNSNSFVLQEKEQLIGTPTKFEEAKLIHHNDVEIRTYDCSSSVRFDLKNLFLNYNTLTQPLTAMTVVFKTKSDMSIWSIEIEKERNRLTEEFNKLAHEISKYLNSKQYWVDFIDPSNGKPYYGPSTSDALFETDDRFRHFGFNIVDLGCCRVIEHLKYGKKIFSNINPRVKKTDSFILFDIFLFRQSLLQYISFSFSLY
jgi:hypothetical protein